MWLWVGALANMCGYDDIAIKYLLARRHARQALCARQANNAPISVRYQTRALSGQAQATIRPDDPEGTSVSAISFAAPTRK
jgi:hypothetical protein